MYVYVQDDQKKSEVNTSKLAQMLLSTKSHIICPIISETADDPIWLVLSLIFSRYIYKLCNICDSKGNAFKYGLTTFEALVATLMALLLLKRGL